MLCSVSRTGYLLESGVLLNSTQVSCSISIREHISAHVSRIAVNIEHKSRKHLTYRTGDLANVPVAERINAFVTLVFGSSVLALLVSTTSDDINDVADTRNLLEQYQNQAVYGINA